MNKADLSGLISSPRKPNNKLFLEVNASGGKFCVSWIQGFENDAYVKTLQSLLRENGINCEVSGPFLHEWPNAVCPDRYGRHITEVKYD